MEIFDLRLFYRAHVCTGVAHTHTYANTSMVRGILYYPGGCGFASSREVSFLIRSKCHLYRTVLEQFLRLWISARPTVHNTPWKDMVSTGPPHLRFPSVQYKPTILQTNLVRIGHLILSVYRLPCGQWGCRQTALNGDWPSNLEALPCCSSRRDMITASLWRRTNCDTFFKWDTDLAPPNLLPPKIPLSLAGWDDWISPAPHRVESGSWEHYFLLQSDELEGLNIPVLSIPVALEYVD